MCVKILRLCLVIVFIFYFQKLIFGNIKKNKNKFLVFFEIKKHVWLVEIKKKKKKFFEEKKLKILKYVVIRF